MFGYTGIHSQAMTWKMYRCYRNYYCGTCFALEQNYGQLCRFLLSYDTTLIGLIMECHQDPLQERFHCFGKCREKHCMFYGQQWGQIAAMNILLINEKLKDDINDERSLRAHFLHFLLFPKIRKATALYPQMAKQIAQGYRQMYQLEKEYSNIRKIEDCFAEMMVRAIEACTSLEEWKRDYIRAVARWIYYIDALDDYESDFQKKQFNALHRQDASTLYAYTKQYLPEIGNDLHYIYQDLNVVNTVMNTDTPERQLLAALIRTSMASTTDRVLRAEKKPRYKLGIFWDGRKK